MDNEYSHFILVFFWSSGGLSLTFDIFLFSVKCDTFFRLTVRIKTKKELSSDDKSNCGVNYIFRDKKDIYIYDDDGDENIDEQRERGYFFLSLLQVNKIMNLYFFAVTRLN